MKALLALLIVALCTLASVEAPARSPFDPVGAAGIDPRLGAVVPTALPLTDETGATVTLARYLGRAPLLLVPVYYHCPNLCGATLDSLFAALEQVPRAGGQDWQAVAYSIDPSEGPSVAAEQRRLYRARFPQAIGPGVHLLTASAAVSQALSAAIGFRYAKDEASDQFAHDSVIVALAPDGTITRYVPGVTVDAPALSAALSDARAERIDSVAGQIRFLCYHLLPTSNRNSLLIGRLLEFAAAATLAVLAALIAGLVRKRRSHSP